MDRSEFLVGATLLIMGIAAVVVLGGQVPVRAPVAIRGEIPHANPLANTGPPTWTLAFAPISGAGCYRNGLRQASGIDYTLNGAVISSPYWQPGDTLLCDYEHD
jgi:hypothetical protein